MSTYRYCVVPMCKSTTITTPTKRFFKFPTDGRRNIWMKSIRRLPSDLSVKSVKYICEDHFDLENDLEIWIQYKYSGYKKAFFKKGVVPHKFDCQIDRKLAHTSKERSLPIKRARKQIVDDIVGEQNVIERDFHSTMELEVAETLINIPAPLPSKSAFSSSDKAAQCNLKRKVRSKSTQCNFKCHSDKIASPTISPSTESEYLSSTEIASVTTSSGSWNVESHYVKHHYVESCFKYDPNITINLLKKKSRNYLGIPEECMGIIPLICSVLQCDELKVFLTLLKLKKNYTFEDLGDRFGISESQASRIYSKFLGFIAKIFGKFIFWPSEEKIEENLPIPFRANFKKVQSIIDCFEVEIEQPSDPVKQSLTWSQYKHCNTMKFLVSATPNGMINFISEGFGGRTSDVAILKLSGFLNVVPAGSWVMADRGFKGIDIHLAAIGCKLVRPPSVSADEKLTRLDVLKSKKIASLRIHIERVIRRLREFSSLKPHACVKSSLIKHLDDMVKIAAGISNIQGDLVKL